MNLNSFGFMPAYSTVIKTVYDQKVLAQLQGSRFNLIPLHWVTVVVYVRACVSTA